MKKVIKMIVGNIQSGYNMVYGGTPMTVDCIMRAMEKSEKYQVIMETRHSFLDKPNAAGRIAKFRESADIFHVDDTSVLTEMYKAGHNPPDVIGPISRSPVKEYKAAKSNGIPNISKTEYPEDWFYSAKVIRLNFAEEFSKKYDLRDKVTLIEHGVNTDAIRPDNTKKKKYILWAGQEHRFAKNFEMFKDIMEITELPAGYDFKIMSKYKVADYWEILKETAILVNTSRYESFCCAMFEAKAAGVPTIYRKGLHGIGVKEGCGIQVEYLPLFYKAVILDLLNNIYRLLESGADSRAYCEKHASLDIMCVSLEGVYDECSN